MPNTLLIIIKSVKSALGLRNNIEIFSELRNLDFNAIFLVCLDYDIFSKGHDIVAIKYASYKPRCRLYIRNHDMEGMLIFVLKVNRMLDFTLALNLMKFRTHSWNL